MPIAVTDLRPGERVVLNCPKARAVKKREAQFEGVFKSLEDAQLRGNYAAVMISEPTAEFLSSGQSWARFLLGRRGGADMVAAFLVEPDGSMREDEGRRVFIERRMTMGQG